MRMTRGRGEGHVLVITANEGRRIRVVRLLARAGYSVQLAITLREALHSLAHGNTAWWQEPDVILLDQESLGAAARVVISAVRNAELAVQIVVLSAFGAADDVISCLRAGADDYISLPAEPEQILDVLRRVLAAPTVT
jgi:DNA-binding response OmpR family regulator